MLENNPRKNSSLIKRNLKKEGNFSQVSNKILFDPRLSDSAKNLIIAISQTNLPEIRVTYFAKKFNWSKGKLSAVVKNLEKSGYLKIEKYPKGKGKGFHYFYTISEFGNLNNESIENLNESNQKFKEVVFKYEKYFQYKWFETLLLESNGNPEAFEKTIEVFLKFK